MALEIIRGNVVFNYDLSVGPVTITNPKDVADGKWHEVIAERFGLHYVLLCEIHSW